MKWRDKGAAVLAAFLYAQGLLGFAAASAAILHHGAWPSFGSGYGVDTPVIARTLGENR